MSTPQYLKVGKYGDYEEVDELNQVMEDELLQLANSMKSKDTADDIRKALKNLKEVKDETLVYEHLCNMMNEFVPPYCSWREYTLGDGEFGVYPDVEDAKQVIKENDGYVVDDLADVPFCREPAEVLLINDHGNVTFGVQTRDTFEEIWAVV